MGRTALVVDDSVTIRKLVSRTLQQAGFEVIEAGNGQEGLNALKGRALSIIITDVNMPVMDGLEFIRGIRDSAEHKFTPVIFLTTEVEATKRDQAKAAGATGWLVKPFSAEKILSVVQRVVPAA